MKASLLLFGSMILSISLVSCDYEFELPEAGSIADATPPSADFSVSQNEGPSEEWKTYDFGNLSKSATTYAWDFGDGNTSSDVDGVNTYPGEGTFTVTLTASDALGVQSTMSKTIEVVEPEAPAALLPEIVEAGFDMGNDSRDPWRNGDLGGVIQITSSPVHEGSNAAKFPSAGDRIAYQELTVSPNTDYVLTYWYTMKTSGTGSITVAMLGGGSFTDIDVAKAAAIASFEGSDQTSSNDYVKVDLPFNSGVNSTVSILVTNVGVESRVDTFSLALATPVK